jgi:isoleucyl-tRNA synthetase
LTKLIAPVVPFLAETMYQNLVTPGTGQPESVHLCEYPQVDESLIDQGLSVDMNALLRLVSLGSAARNTVKIKRRQPLAELKVQPGRPEDSAAVQRFANQLCEELNVRKVSLHDPATGPLLTTEVQANMRSLGQKYRERLKEVQAAIAAAPAAELAARVQVGQPFDLPTAGGPASLDPTDVVVRQRAPEGWAGVVDRETQVILDTRISEALAREGMARDVVRHINALRKEANLEMDDRIELHLETASERLRQAIEAHRDYIATETLTTRRPTKPLQGEVHQARVKVEGQELTITLKRVGT